tara:strand:+ start:210 stop:1106 length:897 start_codon:yes stop_codon:yes gene_type:complete
VCTVGYFDGVHLGHKKIIEKLVNDASKNKGKSILVSFWPHPRKVLYPKDNFDYIQSNEDKFMSIEKLGVDVLYLIEFTKKFSKVTAEKFVDDILVDKLHINKLIIGYNHHFGYKREGNFNYLQRSEKDLAFDIEEVKKKEISKNFKISSSEIRNEILKGNMSKVNMMLGYKYFIKGEVVKGDGIGKTLDFPTANIKIHNEDKILPSDGVYAGYAMISNKKFIGMINIGNRPTVEGKERRVEMNIFNYSDILYGKEMKISFIKRIRNEQKFKNLDDLSNQLKKDKLETIKIIENEEIRN